MSDRRMSFKLIVGALIILLIRWVGFENITSSVLIVFLLLGICYFTWAIFNYKIDKKEKKYFQTFAVILILLSTTFLVMYLIQQKIPNLMVTIKPILLPVMLFLYISVAVSVWVWVIMRNKK